MPNVGIWLRRFTERASCNFCAAYALWEVGSDNTGLRIRLCHTCLTDLRAEATGQRP